MKFYNSIISKQTIDYLALLLILFLSLNLNISCDTTEQQNKVKILLEAEDASCTEAWLNLKIESIALPIEITLFQGDSLLFTTNINSSDTTLFVDNLLPNQNYSFYSAMSPFSHSILKSNVASVTTMDTTSHNFIWETFEFGEQSNSYFKDVAIINENNIWAVGEIHTNETDQFDSNGVWVQPYNAVHWDGTTWELKRILVDFHGNMIFLSLEGIFAFSATDIWLVSSLPIHGDGEKWKIYDVREFTNSDLSLSKAWGSSSNDMYFVGRAGSIAHYNGSSWEKIESGTEVGLLDICGIKNSTNNGYEVYFTIADNQGSISKITYNNSIQEINLTHVNFIRTIWGLNEKEILVGGVGLFKQKDKIWIKEKLDMEVLVMDIDGENYNNIVSVGLNGVLNYYNGISWKTHEILNGNLSTVSVKNNIIATIGMKFNYENVIIIGRRE